MFYAKKRMPEYRDVNSTNVSMTANVQNNVHIDMSKVSDADLHHLIATLEGAKAKPASGTPESGSTLEGGVSRRGNRRARNKIAQFFRYTAPMRIKILKYSASARTADVQAFVDIELDGWLRLNGIHFQRNKTLRCRSAHSIAQWPAGISACR